MNRSAIVKLLPAVGGSRDRVTENQTIPDIIRYVEIAHKKFAPDYKAIAGEFEGGTIKRTAQKLFDFLKENVSYKVESDKLQTLRSPGVLLGIGSGDCKHYASFIGGVLGQLGYDWRYRFGAYDLLDTDPGHVFVVADDNGKELWIDPVLDELDQRDPVYYWKRDKKISGMALEIMAGIGRRVRGLGVTDKITSSDTAFTPPTSSTKDIITNGIYYMILIFGDIPELYTNPPVRFFVDGQPFKLPKYVTTVGTPVPKLPTGLTVQYATSFQGVAIPANMIRPTVEGGGLFIRPLELAGSGAATNQQLVANQNLLLNVLTCATGIIQNAYQSAPDALRIQRMRIRLLENRNSNFLIPKEINTLAGHIIEGIKDAVSVVGKGFVKFIGIIPRTAFLTLLRLNVKGMATHLNDNLKISASASQIKSKWEGFGGQFSSLQDAAADGSTKKALGQLSGIVGNNYMGEPMTAAAALAAAAPLIALLANFLKSVNNPALNAIVDEAVSGMNKILVAAGEDPISVAESMGGKPIQIDTGNGSIIVPPDHSSTSVMSWIDENPMIVAGGAAVIVLAATAGKRTVRRKRRA